MNQGFPKSHRLLKRQEFVLVYSEGTPYRNAGFHLFLRKRKNGGPTRIGLTASRSAGPSVARNRLKRRARESFRLLYHRVLPGADLVVNFHRSLAEKPKEEFDRLFKHILRKAGVLQDSRLGEKEA